MRNFLKVMQVDLSAAPPPLCPPIAVRTPAYVPVRRGWVAYTFSVLLLVLKNQEVSYAMLRWRRFMLAPGAGVCAWKAPKCST